MGEGNMDKLRCAVIGAGSMGAAHALNAETSGLADITAVCSRSLKSAETLVSRLDKKIPVYTDYCRMLDQEKLDSLVVCLPPGAHRGEVEDAAQRRIHLFLEKPLALDLEKAQRMLHAAEKSGVVTQVDFQHRFHPVVQRLKALLETGEAGFPSLMQAGYYCNSLHTSWWGNIPPQTQGQSAGPQRMGTLWKRSKRKKTFTNRPLSIFLKRYGREKEQ